jgi:toxin ParE1/3/4
VFEIELLSQAENELAEAFDWYEEQLSGLGNKLYKEINHYLTTIGKNPYHYPVKYTGDLHSVALNKFPYIIIYWVDKVNNLIIVVSLFHTSRKPSRL